MQRVKCMGRPVAQDNFRLVDNQITPGKFYDVHDVCQSFGETYYTVVGDDGVEIQRPAAFFSRPLKRKVKKVLVVERGKR